MNRKNIAKKKAVRAELDQWRQKDAAGVREIARLRKRLRDTERGSAEGLRQLSQMVEGMAAALLSGSMEDGRLIVDFRTLRPDGLRVERLPDGRTAFSRKAAPHSREESG